MFAEGPGPATAHAVAMLFVAASSAEEDPVVQSKAERPGVEDGRESAVGISRSRRSCDGRCTSRVATERCSIANASAAEQPVHATVSLARTPGAALNYASIVAFLKKFFNVTINAAPTAGSPQNFAYFPMFEELSITPGAGAPIELWNVGGRPRGSPIRTLSARRSTRYS